MKIFNLKNLQHSLCVVLSTIGLLSSSPLSAVVFDPMTTNYFAIYHANDSLIWDGDQKSPFYHENGEIVWLGPKNANREFLYENGQSAWKGYMHKEVFFSYDFCSVYHENGVLAWSGVPYYKAFWEKDCAVYHDNGQKAWAGGTYYNDGLSYASSTVYYSNGTLAWKGAIKDDTFFTDGMTVYHTDGSIAWRGQHAKDKVKEYYCGIYYANGQLAWNGKSGSPIYDTDGSVISKDVADIMMPLGDGSYLSVYSSGESILWVYLGGDNCLIFPSGYAPTLSIGLGTGYTINFSPYEQWIPELTVYDAAFKVDYNKWW